MLRDIINEHIETYSPGEEAIRRAIPALKQVIDETTAMRDSWDLSNDGKQLKTLTRTVAAYNRQWGEIGIHAGGEKTNVEDERERTHILDKSNLKALQDFRKKTFADKLQKARQMLADQQSKLKEMRRIKVRRQHSIETQLFRVLKEVGVELSSYHGGSLNGKDVKKVMNNASHIFDQLAAILKEGKRKNCLLSDDDIGLLCLHFWEVYVLWDGAFLLARKIDPTDEDTETYQRFVLAALKGSLTLQCSITPKVHMMLRHVQWQMKNLPGGLGDKMEDWMERLHQWGIRMRRRFRTVQDPLVRAHAREKASSRCNHPDVLAQVDETDAGNKRKLSEKKADLLSARRKKQRNEGRFQALDYFEHGKGERLTWAAVFFYDGKVDSYRGKGDVAEYLCHLEEGERARM